MEVARVLLSLVWGQRLQNEKYRNWLKVGYGIDLLCRGIRPYVERETRAFHASVASKLHGRPTCTCKYTASRKANPYHDIINCSWAIELLSYHGGKPTWNQSDASLWNDPNVGHWEVAKLFMPKGCAKGNSIAEADATGLLNLLCWCSHYKTDATLVGNFRETRNKWAHESKQEFDTTELNAAFLTMKDLLHDPELIVCRDAQDALDKIKELESKSLIDFADIESNGIKEFLISIKDEIIDKVEQNATHASEIKDILQICIQRDADRDNVLLDIKNKIEAMEADKTIQNRRTPHIFQNACNSILSLLFMTFEGMDRLIPNRTTLFFVSFLLAVTILEENVLDFGCERSKFEDPFELKQFDFTESLNRAREGFVGRRWLFNNITESLEKGQGKSKGVMIIGAPGFGKSALIANLICSKLSNFSLHNQILGYHLCISSDKRTLDGAKFVRNLAYMIAWKLQKYKNALSQENFIQRVLKVECLGDPSGCFEQGILTPLLQLELGFQNPMYIVVDALDECLNEKQHSPGRSIVDILRHKIKQFPTWLKVIATSRNVTSIRRKLGILNVIELYPDDPENLRDIERFLTSKLEKSIMYNLRRYILSKEDMSISSLVKKSQGNFLYIKLILEYLQSRDFISESFKLPDTINSVYEDFFDRKYDSIEEFRAPRKIFEILVATRSPITVTTLYSILSTENQDFDFDYDFFPILEELSMFLLYTQEKESTISVFHHSLTEWLTDGPLNKGGIFYVNEKNGNRALANYFLKDIHEKCINVNPKFIYDLSTYIVLGGSLKRHIDSFFKLDPKLIKVKDNRTNSTALHLAAEAENEKVLSILLSAFKDANIEDHKGYTPAFLAVKFGRLKNLLLLHEKGASLSHTTKALPLLLHNSTFDETMTCKRRMCGYTLLHLASQNGHKDIVKYLIENGMNVSILSTSGNSAVQLAAEFGHIEIMKLLLSHGADADNTCLYYAALYGQVEIVKFLLKKGIQDSCIYCTSIPSVYRHETFLRVSDNLRHCNTALHAAAIGDYPDVIEVLLSSKHNAINCINRFGKEPFHEAVHQNNYRAVNAFLKHAVNIMSKCKFSVLNVRADHKFCDCGYTPLHLAAKYGYAGITNLLLEHKADYNATDCKGMQPIHVASCRGHADVLSILVENGADINSKGPNALTPIHYACKCKAPEIFDKLFTLGADGLALTADGKTPMHILIQDYFIDTKFYFVDPYAIHPIDPVYFESTEDKVIKSHMRSHSWLTSSTKFLQSFTKSDITLSDLNGLLGPLKSFLSYDYVLPDDIIGKISTTLLGSDRHINTRIVVLSTPAPLPADIGLATFLQNQHSNLNQLRKSSAFPTFVKKTFSQALITMTAKIKFKCFSLINFTIHNLVYAVDMFLRLGMDVNCEELGLSPLLAYLRQGGRNMAKVLTKHNVTIDIQCGEYFQDSVFHLAAYHKLHYLQYLSIFQNPLKWEEYLGYENALFDYLFDIYEETSTIGQLKLTRVRNGPVTLAIKSHFRGFKIIDECLDNEGYTALQRAAQGGNFVAVKHFLEWGVDAWKESPEEFDILTLAIWYAVKYRPYLNLHKPSVLTALEIEFASLTAGVILKHFTRNKPFNIGCDINKSTPTLLHLSATRGMWRFINDLFIAKDHWNVIGLTANCPTRDNITPMYLAKLHGGDNCEWDNPWCKVVGILSQYGGSMIYPDRVTEYFLILNFLFHELPDRFDMNELNHDEIQMLSGDDRECKDLQQENIITGGTSIWNVLFNDYNNLSNNYPQGLKDAHFTSTILQYLNIISSINEKEKDFQLTKIDYYLFLSSQLLNMKWSLYMYRNIDIILRCVPHTMDPISKYPAISNLNTHHVFQEEVKKKGSEKENNGETKELENKIISSWFDPFPDMCSSKSTIDFETLDKLSQKNRLVFNNHHKAFAKEIEKAKQAIRQQKVKIGIFDSVDKLFHDFERRMHCQIKDISYKYARFKFLLHTMKFWSAQVKNLGMYPAIADFVSERIQDIFQKEDRKEMLPFIIRLAKVDPTDKYGYLRMIRFSAPPLEERFRKQEDQEKH